MEDSPNSETAAPHIDESGVDIKIQHEGKEAEAASSEKAPDIAESSDGQRAMIEPSISNDSNTRNLQISIPFRATVSRRISAFVGRNPSPSSDHQEAIIMTQSENNTKEEEVAATRPDIDQIQLEENSYTLEISPLSVDGFPQVDIIIVHDVTEGKEVSVADRTEQEHRKRSDPTVPSDTQENPASVATDRHRIERPQARRTYSTKQPQIGSQTLPAAGAGNSVTAAIIEIGSDNKNAAGYAEQKETLVHGEDGSNGQGVQEGSPCDNAITSGIENVAPQVGSSITDVNPGPISHRRDLSSSRGSVIPNLSEVYWLSKNENRFRIRIPQPRVLHFRYPVPQVKAIGSLSPEKELEKHAQMLLLHLAQYRQPDDYQQVPIVFVGHGFGCMIIERALVISEGNVTENIKGKEQQKSGTSEKQNDETKWEQRIEEKERLSFLTAGTIFLDAPIQISGYDPKPLTKKKRWVTDWLESKPSDTREIINAEQLWKEFCDVVDNAAISAVWLQDHKDYKLSRLRAESPVLFAARYDPEKFPDENDGVYSRVVHEIRRCLVFKTAAIDLFEKQLIKFVDEKGFRVSVKDHQGRNPLHWAVERRNVNGVAFLASRSKYLVRFRDSQGATPLHVAVQQAAKSVDTDPIRKDWRNLIRELLKNRIEVVKDKKGKTAWDYAPKDDHFWIHKILKERPLIEGAVDSSRTRDLEPMDNPQDIRKRACQDHEPILLEIFNKEKDGGNNGESRELFNQRPASLYKLIYDESGGLENILRTSRPPNLKAICKWVHLPANNEQWVHDLFIRMNIMDTSMKGQRSEGPRKHHRYMIPQAKLYKHTRKRQDRKEAEPAKLRTSRDVKNSLIPESSESNALVIYLPILAFETHRYRKKNTKAIHKKQRINLDEPDISRTKLLLQAYLHNSSNDQIRQLHPRRTLDQFSYYMLDSTEARDNTQVVSRWAEKQKVLTGDRPILMVDQLWLWVLADGTVVTCFPASWNTDEDYDLTSTIIRRFDDHEDRDVIKSADDLIYLIIRTSVDFFQRQGPANLKFQECFQSSINDIANHHATLFKEFKSTTQALASKKLSSKQQAEKIDNFFELDKETELLESILDIQDELNIIHTLLSQQREVLAKLCKLHGDDNDSKQLRDTKQKHVHWPDVESTQRQRAGDDAQGAVKEQRQSSNGASNPWLFLSSVNKVPIDVVDNNISIVKDMLRYAGGVKDELNHLLDLKQKQANAWEARFTREGSEGAKKQGKILLIFTFVTIVFLPLSFITSFLALDIDQFPKDEKSGETNWPLERAVAYLFGISAAFIVPFLVIVFRIDGISKLFERKTGLGPSIRPGPDHDPGSESSEDDSDSDSEVNFHLDIEDDQFAPIFGRFMFHVKLWGLRGLWEYRSYGGNEDESVFNWNDEIDRDYPLRHYTTKIRNWFKNQMFRWRSKKLIESSRSSSMEMQFTDPWSPDSSTYQEWGTVLSTRSQSTNDLPPAEEDSSLESDDVSTAHSEVPATGAFLGPMFRALVRRRPQTRHPDIEEGE
ncbi:hypothetical protein F5Y19DRAFT_424716 [Xylariaceae sp. FL1651]|nr:hypothetical protein F5Y19DRAFT_424716 [Xylariaceae sp. FL1651]